jgi:hypothetical protein
MRRAAALMAAVAAALAVAAGCASRKSGPTAPPAANLPPEVVATQPAARSTAVPYDTEVWADFAAPLDPASVGPTTVLLKNDTRRIPARVVYEPEARRVRVTPLEPLTLRRTYTVEITPAVRTAAGGALAETWFWQFTTNSLRHLDSPNPPSGSVNLTPVAPLAWPATETTAGDIVYRVWTGPDSARVAGRSDTPVTTSRAYQLAAAPWPPGAVYWTVRAENRSTGETNDSPVWRFDALAADTPTDSLVVPMVWWGAYFSGTRPSLLCNPASLTSGILYTTVVRWATGVIPPGTQIARAALVLTTSTVVDAAQRSPSLFATTAPVRDNCLILYPGPPYADELLGALAVARNDPENRLRYQTDRFASHLQATVQQMGLSGYMLRSTGNVTYTGQQLTVHYYRVP